MSEVITEPATRRLQTIPLSRLHPQEGFNPRTKRDKRKFAELAQSVKRRGVLQPILVAPHPEVDGEYVIVAGEGRYLAAGDAALMEVPCVIDGVDPETGGLDDALIENLVREDLTPVDEARALARLLASGLNERGIAQRVSRSQRHVRERLLLLELPERVQRGINAGTVPLGAVPSLAKLAAIHPELPTVAVKKVTTKPGGYHYGYQPRWSDVIEDPISVVLAAGYDIVLPSDVCEDNVPYPASRFTLSEKAAGDLAKLARLCDEPAESITVRFGRALTQQAITLGAGHAGQRGVLIVGQDVADQLAGDAVAELLRQARRRVKAQRTHEQAQAESRGELAADGAPLEGEALRAQRAARREEAKEARDRALGHNEALGAAVLKHLGKLKGDARVLKILASVALGSELDKIAARGARYCLPHEIWKTGRQLKSGKTKVELVEPAHCKAPARTFLEGARTPADYSGRLLSLLVMARFADEAAVAQSRRSLYTLSPGSDLPWSSEVIELVDEIAAEQLPEHLTAPVLEAVRAKREAAQQAAAERAAAAQTLEAALADPAALSDVDREAAIAAVPLVHHSWTVEYREAMTQLTVPTEQEAAPDAGGEDQTESVAAIESTASDEQDPSVEPDAPIASDAESDPDRDLAAA